MNKRITRGMNTIFAMLIICSSLNLSLAQTTAFTYQGNLADGGTPATGTYDFQVKLFDTQAVGTGTQQGATITVSNITVTGGNFTLALDFGACASCFNGADRFLEISVKPTGGATFTTLSPRQPITSTPHAIRSLLSTAADGLSVACVSCITSSQIQSVNGSAVSGPIPLASLPAGSANYIQNTTTTQAATNFNISGNGKASILDATTHYTIGGVRMLAANGPFNNGMITMATSNTFVGEGAGVNTTPNAMLNSSSGKFNSFFGTQAGWSNTTGNSNSFFGSFVGELNATGAGNSFFGERAGEVNTFGNSNSFFGERAGWSNTTGNSNSFFGVFAGQSNMTGSNNTMVGFGANVGSGNLTNATAIGALARVDQSNSIVLGSSNVNVGVGTSAPVTKLEVVGDWTGEEGAVRITGNLPTIKFTGGALAGNQSWIIHVGSSGPGNLEFYRRTGPATWVPAFVLASNSTVRIPTLGSGGGTETLCRNGSLEIATCGSSLRYKTAISRFTSGLELIHRLRPITYSWKQGGIRDVGLAAEEVAEVEPLLVTHNEKGEVEGVKYDRITVALINAMKELKAEKDEEITALKAENDTLKQQLKQQEKRLRRLEAAMRQVTGKK